MIRQELLLFGAIMNKYIKSFACAATVVGALAVMTPQAIALTVDGAVYTLNDTVLGTNDNQLTLSIDLSGYTGGGSFLNSLAFNIGTDLFDSSYNYLPGVSFNLLSTPDTLSNWIVAPGGLAASGCNGSGVSWVCIHDTANSGLGLNISSLPSNLQFVFDFSGVPYSGLWLKADYTDANGNKMGSLISQQVSPVPEPETYAMLLVGLGLIGFIARRKGQNDRTSFA